VSEFLQMMDAAASSLAADVAFGLVVLGSFAIAILSVMFFLFAVRGAWRWLIRHTWNDVIASTARKALK
jgi:hypothetical protein